MEQVLNYWWNRTTVHYCLTALMWCLLCLLHSSHILLILDIHKHIKHHSPLAARNKSQVCTGKECQMNVCQTWPTWKRPLSKRSECRNGGKYINRISFTQRQPSHKDSMSHAAQNNDGAGQAQMLFTWGMLGAFSPPLPKTTTPPQECQSQREQQNDQ